MKKDNKNDTMTAREVAVLVEEFKSQFRVFGESLDAVKSRLDSVFNQVGKLTEDVSIIKIDIKFIKADIAEIKNTLKGHDKRLTHLEEVSPK